MLMEGHLFCRTRNDRGFIARYRFTSERLCLEKVKKRISLWVVSGFECMCSVKKSQKTTHCSTTNLALNAFITYFCLPLVKFLDISFLQFPLGKFLDIFIYSMQSKKRSWRQLFRSRLIVRMMQSFSKLEELTRRKLWLWTIRCILCSCS